MGVFQNVAQQNQGGIFSQVANSQPQEKPSLLASLVGKGEVDPGIADAQGGNLKTNAFSLIAQHPVEATKGAIKNIASFGVAVDKGLEAIGKPLVPGAKGLDYTAVGELTKLNNSAQEAGSTVSNFLPFERAFSGVRSVASAVGKVFAEKQAPKIVAKNTETLTQLISPKPTIKEAKLAETQGRLVKGKEPTLLRSGTSDTVLPSEKTKQAVSTIQKYIPDAHTFDEPTLYSALDKKTAEIAQKLQPEMKAVKISPETVKKSSQSWKELKAKQLESADASEEANVLKEQRQFESRLNKINNPSMGDIFTKARSGDMSLSEMKTAVGERATKIEQASLDDIHQARIEYDNSIPDNVKNANSLSSESLQNKRIRWLENRKVLNDLIHDTENGLGQTSRTAFKDMSDMYNAKQQILSKAKIETTQKLSKLRQFGKDHPVVSSIVGATAVGATGIPSSILKGLTGN